MSPRYVCYRYVLEPTGPVQARRRARPGRRLGVVPGVQEATATDLSRRREPYSRDADAGVQHQKRRDEDGRIRRRGRQVGTDVSSSIQMRQPQPPTTCVLLTYLTSTTTIEIT